MALILHAKGTGLLCQGHFDFMKDNEEFRRFRDYSLSQDPELMAVAEVMKS